MRYLFFLLLSSVALYSCSNGNSDKMLQAKVDSLQAQLNNSYRPGLGEFMLGLQLHHSKLWSAGQARNWKLASFEIDEIKETIDDIKQYNTDRPEIASLPMIEPALDSVAKAIKNGDARSFDSGFVLLTNTCNNCHRATKHEFNVIKVPDGSPYSNQVFTP
jgi:hypothetical protein